MATDAVTRLYNKQIAPYSYGNGRILFFDKCEGSVVIWKETAGGAGAITSETTNPFTGLRSYQMNLVALDANTIQIGRYMPHSLDGYVGIDFYFAISDGDYNGPTELIMKLWDYTINSSYRGFITFFFDGNSDGATIKYLDSTGTYVALPIRLPLNAVNDELEIFHHVKLVCDFKTKSYHYLMINNQFFDLRNHKMPGGVGANLLPLTICQIEGKGKTGGADTMIYLDQITITDKEKLPDFPELYLDAVEM